MAAERDVAGFFDIKGAVGVMILLGDEDGKLNGELDDELDIAPATLKNVLQKGEDEELITTGRKPGDHGNAERYILTDYGRKVREKMVEIGMEDTYHELVELRAQFEAQSEELDAWIETELTTDKQELYHQDKDPGEY